MADTLDLQFPEPKPARGEAAAGAGDDQALDAVESWFRSQSKMEERFGQIFRQAIDEVLDGQRTARFDIYADGVVAKTERTYLGTKVEIICQDEFHLDRGRKMDYSVAGYDVDAKFSMRSLLGQEIPREAVGHICLLMHASDKTAEFSVGLVHVTPEILNASSNQDGKKTISAIGRSRVRWLVRKGKLPENQLLRLPSTVLRAIFDPALSKQERVNQLFRLVQGRIIYRRTVTTVAQQHDGPKRVRDARLALADQGIIILGYRDGHPAIARALELAIPRQSEWISVRVVPRPLEDTRPAALIQGGYYVQARHDEASFPVTPRYGVGE
ncbi:NaeI family type II restriction endonuclease [Nonomuraea sp. NPDC049695]|uniref:NaeI family type II restriction endonuclease n=1 Tax=Nonomuraea sp. NPDC049695 TaxID=3154734 RepID=UPI003431AD52